MTRYRLNAIIRYMVKSRGWVSANEVAEDVGMSWNTAKADLDYLEEQGYILKRGKRRAKYKIKPGVQ